MTMTNMGTFATVNGVREYTTVNALTLSGGATDESILIYGNGTIGVSPASAITTDFLRCNLTIIDPISATQWFNISEASLSYNADDNNRYSTGSAINFEDCSVVFNAPSIRAIFLSDCNNTRVFNAGSTLLTYTQAGANLNDMHLENTNWEVNGQPSEAANIKLVNSAITNFLVPRLDFSYIDLTASGNNLTLNVGNGGNVSVYMWNFVQFDNTKINHQHVNNVYNDGVSASWLFQDRDSGLGVDDVLVINSSDKSGSMTELGRFTTNSSGLMVGTYDSRFETTGASQVRDALFLYENYSDQAGTDYTNGGLSYSIVPVVNQIEIRSYLHEAPTGYTLGDNYVNGEQGTIASDFSVDAHQTFILNNEASITETNKATALAYTSLDLEDPLKLFDRSRAAWQVNDGYAYINRTGQQLDLEDKNLILDATAPSVYDAGGGANIIVNVAEYTGGATATTGVVLTANGALLSGGTFDCTVAYNSGASTTLTNVTCNETLEFLIAGTYILDGCTVNEVTNTSGGNVTLQLINGSTVTTNTGPSITVEEIINFSVTGLIANSRIQIYNVTTATEIVNQVVPGTSFNSTYIEGVEFTNGDTVRLRVTNNIGLVAYEEYESISIVGVAGFNFLAQQVLDASYATWAIDGSTVTTFTADYVNDEIDLIVATNFDLRELGAWWSYNGYTEQGIREFFGGIVFEDEANLRIENTIVNIFLDNITATNVHQLDNRRLYRADGARPVKEPTTDAGIDVEWRSPVTIGNIDTINNDLTTIKAQTALIPSLV